MQRYKYNNRGSGFLCGLHISIAGQRIFSMDPPRDYISNTEPNNMRGPVWMGVEHPLPEDIIGPPCS
jgi:hypothetical protein